MTAPAPRTVIEVKRSLDGHGVAERRFECELVDATPARAVVLFRFVREGRALDSYGLFWRRRAYNCYYAVPAGGEEGRAPVFVRFDVVRDVTLALAGDPPEVRYTDLLLDLWVDADGARWEDEDEVEAAARAGALTPSDAARIEAARALLGRRHRAITSEVRSLLRGLGARV